jgi:uncharacterized protein (TIGR00369 family)
VAVLTTHPPQASLECDMEQEEAADGRQAGPFAAAALERRIMEIRTHRQIDPGLCGRLVETDTGYCRAELPTTPEMAVDTAGLVHGGFVFGLADHAAMVAVNDPNVVLGAAEVKFLKPVAVGETVTAEARVVTESGKKRIVEAVVQRGGETVFSGTFVCFVLDRHVLS